MKLLTPEQQEDIKKRRTNPDTYKVRKVIAHSLVQLDEGAVIYMVYCTDTRDEAYGLVGKGLTNIRSMNILCEEKEFELYYASSRSVNEDIEMILEDETNASCGIYVKP